MGIGKDVVDNAADKAKQAAKNVAKEYAKKIGGLLLKNPYFWIVVAILFIEIVIVGTFAEIESNAGNDTDDYLTGSSDEQWEQFIRFIAYMEGGNTIYKNSKGQDCYMVINDTLVGLDMTFGGYRGYFQELGYDTSEGALIPVEDAVQKREEDIENKYYNYIDSHTSEYSLTQYQKFALTSRAFNHGSEGALYTAYGNENFMDAYKNYWKQSRDDKFKKTKEPDLNHKLYTRAMNKTVSGVINGVYYPYLEGLDRRRQAEFRLFQCGWYYWAGCMDEQFIEESYGGSGGAEGILASAKNIHTYMERNNYAYCDLGGSCNHSGSHGLDSSFEASKTGHHLTCCATYVSWVLRDAGLIDTCVHHCGNTTGIGAVLGSSKYFTKIKITSYSQAKPGDILQYGEDHTEIYAGNGKVYNAGYTGSPR